MAITLYPDQEYLVQTVLERTDNGKRRETTLITSPSASGKTYMIAGLIKQLLESGFTQSEILVISPSYEISDQIYHRINLALDTESNDIIIFGSVKASRLDLENQDHQFKVIIIDEAHHTEADTYKRTIMKYPDAVVYGFTATPMRNDDKELSDTYQHMLSGLSVRELIKAGRLSEFEYYVPNIEGLVESSYLKIEGKTFSQMLPQPKLERIIYADIVNTWHDKASDRQTILFASSIEESKLLADEFKFSGVKAEHVDGSIMSYEDRRDVIQQFRDGKIQVLCNYNLISEGFDVPDASCVILARPTNSVILHLQQCFRAMRVGADKKQKAIILDHVNNYSRFGHLDDDRGWSLTMDAAEKALAKNPRKATRESKKVTKPYDLDYRTMTDVEMLSLAQVTNPFFEADVEEALKLPRKTKKQRLAVMKELARIQRKYHIRTPYKQTWAYLMALHHGITEPLV